MVVYALTLWYTTEVVRGGMVVYHIKGKGVNVVYHIKGKGVNVVYHMKGKGVSAYTT